MLVGAGERSSVFEADASRSPWNRAGACNLIPLALSKKIRIPHSTGFG